MAFSRAKIEQAYSEMIQSCCPGKTRVLPVENMIHKVSQEVSPVRRRKTRLSLRKIIRTKNQIGQI